MARLLLPPAEPSGDACGGARGEGGSGEEEEFGNFVSFFSTFFGMGEW
jgi:hypothetical protein